MIAGLTAPEFWAVIAITLFAGFVKGAIGFAMPMIMISAFSAALVVPDQIVQMFGACRV